MTAKLTIYNEAMLILGQERLASLAEISTSRYALDDAYDGVVSYCLEQHSWNFAIRVVSIDASTSITPAFGYSYAFDKPDDFVRTLRTSANEDFKPVFLDDQFTDEPNYWYANITPIYVEFVSDHVNFGKDLSLWPQSFTDYATRRLANRVSKRISGKTPAPDDIKLETMALREARSKDAMNATIKFPPQGSWTMSRSRGQTGLSRWDRRSFT